LGLVSYSQERHNHQNVTASNDTEIHSGERSSSTTVSSKIELSISGEESCCYEVYGYNNTFVYTISLTGGTTWGRHWDVWVTDGTITLVDGLLNNCDPDHWWHTAGDANRTYEFTINWDDNETGIGIIHANVSFQKIGWPITDSREAYLYPYIGKPSTPEYVNVSNSNPYPGQTITCSTNSVEGADTYIWSHSGSGVFSGSGTTVYYTPSSSGTQSIYVRCSNVCGLGYSRSTNINVQQYAPLNVYITGPHTGNNNTWYDWIGHVSGGKPTYDYVWYYSYDGQSYNNIWATLYNTSSLTHTVHEVMPLDMDLYLKLVVTDDLGNQQVAFYETTNTSRSTTKSIGTELPNLTSLVSDGNVLGDLEFNALECSLYPNPTTSIINIPVGCFSEHSSIIIYDSQGNIVLSQKILTTKVDFSKFLAGIYFVRITDSVDHSNKIFKVFKN
jgi:hypothetical protein